MIFSEKNQQPHFICAGMFILSYIRGERGPRVTVGWQEKYYAYFLLQSMELKRKGKVISSFSCDTSEHALMPWDSLWGAVVRLREGYLLPHNAFVCLVSARGRHLQVMWNFCGSTEILWNTLRALHWVKRYTETYLCVKEHHFIFCHSIFKSPFSWIT